ncbi:MAG: sugar phosphate nucleotidyltransferase [Candidatus Thorarchaeota archaeon]
MPKSLISIMEELRKRINTQDTKTKVSLGEIETLKSNVAVVMPAGGRGTRIRTATQNERIHKVMISIDGRESMIERCVRVYSEYGIDKFVILTGFMADVVEAHLGDGSRWGIDIKYSRDPDGKKVGNAGAILNALNNGTMDDTLVSIVHNPDDILLTTRQSYIELLLEGHIKAQKNGCIASLAIVPQTDYPYSGLVIQKGFVQSIKKYPYITVPTHTGITVFDPQVYDYFRKLVNIDIESSFEDVVCAPLAEAGRLFAIELPAESWIPVNDLKGLEKAAAILSRE